jgi:hypothetical protein
VLSLPTTTKLAYLKACRPVQAFEPAVTAALAGRWPGVVADVLAIDTVRSWMLTADAGDPLVDLGNPPELWLEILPRYAELQRGEASHVGEHLASGLPDLRLESLPDQFDGLLAKPLPLDEGEADAARALRPRLEALVDELEAARIPHSMEHADLHNRSVFARRGELRVLDWGDSSVGHPFFSLVVTFDYLRDTGLSPGDPWFDRLRDAYLEPWGAGLRQPFDLAQRLGRVARAIGWGRHHEAMGTGAFPGFDHEFPRVLRTAIDALRTTLPT